MTVKLPLPYRRSRELAPGNDLLERPGVALDVPLAINFTAMPLAPGKRYTWRLAIDDNTEPEWRVVFSVREAAPSAKE